MEQQEKPRPRPDEEEIRKSFVEYEAEEIRALESERDELELIDSAFELAEKADDCGSEAYELVRKLFDISARRAVRE